MGLIIARAFQISDSFKAEPHFNLFSGSEHPLALLGELMLNEYHMLDTQTLPAYSYARKLSHNQLSVETAGAMTTKEKQTPVWDYSNPADEGESVLVKALSLVQYRDEEMLVLVAWHIDAKLPLTDINELLKYMFCSSSNPLDTALPEAPYMSLCKLTAIQPTEAIKDW